MNRYAVFGVIFFGAFFALCAFIRVDVLDTRAAKGITAAFLFGCYCAIVIFGTSGKKRTLSLAGQTVLGIALALSLAGLFNASPEGLALAALLGLMLGFTADRWVQYVQLP